MLCFDISNKMLSITATVQVNNDHDNNWQKLALCSKSSGILHPVILLWLMLDCGFSSKSSKEASMAKKISRFRHWQNQVVFKWAPEDTAYWTAYTCPCGLSKLLVPIINAVDQLNYKSIATNMLKAMLWQWSVANEWHVASILNFSCYHL